MLSLSNLNISFASGLGLSSWCSCQQGIKRGTSEPAVRLRNFTERVLRVGRERADRHFPKGVPPRFCGNLKLQDKTGRPVKCKWHEAQERPRLLAAHHTSAEQNIWVSAFVKMSFPGFLKAKVTCRRKGQEPSSGEVTATNLNSHLSCLLWKQTLTQKWQNRRHDARAKQMKTACFVPGWVTYWEREGKSRGSVVYLQVFTSTWTQPASDDKHVMHPDELEQYDFNSTGRNILQQQSKWPDRGGSLRNNLLSRTAPYHTAK